MIRTRYFRKTFSGSISVIVTTYNWPKALSLVLEALLRQNDSLFEIIIADDGSKPNTKALVKQFQTHSSIKITHVWQPDCGFRAAEVRNRGIAAACGEYLIFLDGDSIPQHDFIKQHRRLAQINHFVSGGRIYLKPTLTQLLLDKKVISPNKGNKLFWVRQRLSGQINRVLPLFLKLFYFPRCPFRQPVPMNRIRSCNLAAWAKDCQKVDGFDAIFTGWGSEDVDFVVRLYNNGVRRKYGYSATEVFHLYHTQNPTPNVELNRQYVLTRIKNKQIQAEKGISKLQ